MKAQVRLPADQLIDYCHFCKVIAQAICPAGEQGLEGIDCITGKLVTYHVTAPAPVCGEEKELNTAGLQCVLLSDDGRTLDQLRVDQSDAATATASTPQLPLGGELNYAVVELSLPYTLTDDDRQLMENLLEDLPELHYPMSEDDAAFFMSAYFKLPNRPAWEPILITAKTIEQRKAEQDATMHHHQKALQSELTRGRIVAVDANHGPVPRLTVGAFIPREQAIAYLDRCGILHCDKEVSGSHDAETQMPAIHQEPLDMKQNAVGQPKLSVKQLQEVVDFHNKLMRQGAKDFCKQTAQRFGISTRRVRYIVEESKKVEEPKALQDARRLEKAWY